jgi:uncharacterized membrane protein
MTAEDMINDILKKAYDIFKNQYVTLIIGTLVALLLMILIITIPPLVFGIYYICNEVINGRKIEVSDVFKGFHYFLTSWGLFLLGGIIVILGFIALVIPGLLLLVLFQYAIAVAIIEKRSAYQSLKRSYDLVKNNFNFSIVFWLLMGIINCAGTFTRIGTLITLPFTSICICLAVLKLSKGKK